MWQPYVRANVWHDWGAEAVLSSPGSAVQVPLLETATRLEFAGGATVKINANLACMSKLDMSSRFAKHRPSQRREG